MEASASLDVMLPAEWRKLAGVTRDRCPFLNAGMGLPACGAGGAAGGDKGGGARLCSAPWVPVCGDKRQAERGGQPSVRGAGAENPGDPLAAGFSQHVRSEDHTCARSERSWVVLMLGLWLVMRATCAAVAYLAVAARFKNRCCANTSTGCAFPVQAAALSFLLRCLTAYIMMRSIQQFAAEQSC